jgi:hypothetical protein
VSGGAVKRRRCVGGQGGGGCLRSMRGTPHHTRGPGCGRGPRFRGLVLATDRTGPDLGGCSPHPGRVCGVTHLVQSHKGGGCSRDGSDCPTATCQHTFHVLLSAACLLPACYTQH